MTITIPPDLEARLKGEASRYGVEPNEYARRLIENALPHAVPTQAVPDQATIDLLNRWQEENATTDPAEVTRINEEFEAFKEAMNQNRLDSEGPHARKIFP